MNRAPIRSRLSSLIFMQVTRRVETNWSINFDVSNEIWDLVFGKYGSRADIEKDVTTLTVQVIGQIASVAILKLKWKVNVRIFRRQLAGSSLNDWHIETFVDGRVR